MMSLHFGKRKLVGLVFVIGALSVCYLLDVRARIVAEYDKYVWHYSDDALVANANRVGHGFCKSKIKHRSTEKLPLESLSDQVQKAICRLQNPTSCFETRLLLCRIRSDCALGCQLHHYITCLMLALGTNRTLVVDNANMRGVEQGLLTTYLPLSDVCTRFTRSDVTDAVELTDEADSNNSDRVAKVTIFHNLRIDTKFHAFAVPDVLSHRLLSMTQLPVNVWWVGQLAKYVTRPQPHFSELAESVKNEIGFAHPIVGVHVRRSDKSLLETKSKTLEDYMARVKTWYEKYENRTGADLQHRRVFLATDDTSVYNEAVERYPEYTFLSLRQSTRAMLVDTQFFHQFNLYYTEELRSIALDVQLLSECDYLVCTFSSNVGRLVYELMSTRTDLPGEFATSLDEQYNYHQHVRNITEVKFPGLER